VFERLGRFVVARAWWVIGAWVVVAAAILILAPTLADVTNQDQTEFLPDSYESIEAQRVAEESFGQQAVATATIVFTRSDGEALSEADQQLVTTVAGQLESAGIDHVDTVQTAPELVAENGRVQLANVSLEGSPNDPGLTQAIRDLRDDMAPLLDGTGVQAGVTGELAQFADSEDEFNQALAIVGTATLVLIIVLLLIIYRSPVAALLPIITVTVVGSIAPGLIAWMAEIFDLQVDPSLQTILLVVLYGIGTDYILFLMFRYRERLREGDDKKQAMVYAVSRVGEVIASAAGVVIVAFMALVLAVLGFFTSLGPALAIAVAVMALAALTLVPAIVSKLGTKVFWPSKSWQRKPEGAVFQRLGKFVARRPAVTALGAGAVLVALAAGTLGLHVNFDQTGQLPDDTESAQAFRDLQEGFPAGAINPTSVYLVSTDGQPIDQTAASAFAATLGGVEGVGQVVPAGADGSPVVLSGDGTVGQINLLLESPPYSNQALDLAGGDIRDVAHAEAPAGTEALVGGLSSAYADIRAANNRDMVVIFTAAALLIALILALLLRSLVAPIYLMVAVVLGFLATLGASVYFNQGIRGEAGLSFTLPMIVYLFVVAIGTDYNILMIARLREEAREGNDPRTSADLAVEHAGPSVTSAGLILAGTFASMLLAGVAFLYELGFAVSIGILLSAFVMALFLVPGLTAVVGHTAWWPGHGDEPAKAREHRPEHTTA
jgi:putative drug exporter of the RND superfamily